MVPPNTIDAHGARPSSVSASPAPKSHWWQWLLAIVIVVGGLWLYRSHNATSDAAAAGPEP